MEQRQRQQQQQQQQQKTAAAAGAMHSSVTGTYERIHLPRYKRFCRPPPPQDYFPAPSGRRAKQKYDAGLSSLKKLSPHRGRGLCLALMSLSGNMVADQANINIRFNTSGKSTTRRGLTLNESAQCRADSLVLISY